MIGLTGLFASVGVDALLASVGVDSLFASVGVDDRLDEIGEMTPRTHLLVMIGAVVCIGFILRLVRRHGLRSKYALLWLTLAVVVAVLGVFPGVLVAVSRLVGIQYPPATFLAVGVGALILIVIQFSWEISRLEERTRVLAESAALLAAEVERLRASVEDEPQAPGDAPGAVPPDDEPSST